MKKFAVTAIAILAIFVIGAGVYALSPNESRRLLQRMLDQKRKVMEPKASK